MPRKGATTAAKPDPDPPTDVPQTNGDEPAKPARRGGRKTAEERAAEREADNATYGADKDGGKPDGGFEDWTKPAYANNPGEVLFDEMDDSDEHYRILWWGPEGTGKTTDTMLVTRILPDTGRVLLINAEAGAKKSALVHHGVDTSRIALYPPKGQQLTFEGLERLFYRLQADLEEDPGSWGAVVWDSITAIYQKLLDDVVEADIRKTAEILQRAKKGRDGRSGNITLRDRFDTDRDDFAQMSNQVRLLLRKYRALHCHLLITALERRDEDKKAKTVEYGPAISPALQTDLLGYMDVVLHTKVNSNGVYYGRTQPTETTRGKDRLNTLPVELVDPTAERIHKYVTGVLSEETDRAQRRLPDREVASRRSLADDYIDSPEEEAPYPTKDGTPDGPPLAGEEDDPPKRPARRRASASSGRTSASAPASAPEETASSEPESDAPEAESVAEPLKASGRRVRSEPPDEPATAEEKPAPRRSGRKTPADRAASQARSEVKAETEGTKSGPATRAAAERARKAKAAQSSSGFSDEPPF